MTEETAAMIEEFSQKLIRTPEYTHYLERKAEVLAVPEKWSIANTYRRARYRLMHDNPDPYELLESFERENDYVHQDPLIEGYLEAEVTVCRLVQELYIKIFAAVDIDIEETV